MVTAVKQASILLRKFSEKMALPKYPLEFSIKDSKF